MTEIVERRVFSKLDLKNIRQEMGPIGIPEDLLDVYSVAWRSNLDDLKKGSKDSRKSKKSDTSKDKKSSNGKVTTDTAPNSSGRLATETISPTTWKKVQQDFTEVVPKSSSKKQRENKEKEKNNDRHDNKRSTNNNTNSRQLNDSRNNKKGGNSDNKGAHGGGNQQSRQKDEADLWDMPTGLSKEESQGLSEREMFELERKKFLALRHQPTSGGGISKEGQYHTESDIIMGNMQSEQALQDEIANQEVSGNSFDFQLKQPKGADKSGSDSGIRSLTASDVMKGMHSQASGVGGGSSSEDMAWFGAMLGGDTAPKGRTKSTDQDFFSHFLSDPVMATPVTPPTQQRDASLDLTPSITADSASFSLENTGSGDVRGGGSSSKSSRLGSLLGIPLSPPAKLKQPSAMEEVVTSGIKELNFPLENSANSGGVNMSTPGGMTSGNMSGTGYPSGSLASNQKSRDLLATLGFSPPRNTAANHFQSPSFSPAGGIQHHHQHQHSHVDGSGNHLNSIPNTHIVNGMNQSISNAPRGQFVFQESDSQSPPLPSPPADHTPGKSTPLPGGSSPAPPSAGKQSGPASGGKRNTMSASSRLQLARMKQQGVGGTKKKIEVSSLFNNSPARASTSSSSSGIKTTTSAPNPASTTIASSSSGTQVLQPTSSSSGDIGTSAVMKPVTVISRSTQPVNGFEARPVSTNSSSNVSTNSKGASLLMKLKK
mmetsp:Transcript_10688/g.17567  ORF Transcript_10688/g.17567 Transcript_10688/m.17567 type:complete len:712 (+) Transcript_10688:106-2241(+)